MSRNNLVDEDMQYIETFMGLFRESSELVLNLRLNRFHGFHAEQKKSLDKHLRGILSLKNVLFVDVTGNSFASVYRRDLFDKDLTLDEKHNPVANVLQRDLLKGTVDSS